MAAAADNQCVVRRGPIGGRWGKSGEMNPEASALPSVESIPATSRHHLRRVHQARCWGRQRMVRCNNTPPVNVQRLRRVLSIEASHASRTFTPDLIIHVDEHHDMMSERPPANFGNFVCFAMRHWPDCRVVWVTPQPIDDPSMWLSEDAWEDVAPRFAWARGLSRRWPKPDVLSVCTSPDFIDQDLRRRLLATVRRRRGGRRS